MIFIKPEGQPYTEKMNLAFRDAHGFGYDEMRQSEDLRMRVEQRRQLDHEKSMRIAAQIGAQAHRG